MRKSLVVFCLLACVTFTQVAFAQMSRQEKKEWKKRIKALKPEQYKGLLEENKSIKAELNSLKGEMENVDSRIKDKNEQITDYQNQIASLRKELVMAKKAPPSTNNRNTEKGVIFKVQIGAFKQKNLTKFSQDNPAFQMDAESGMMK